VRLLAVLTAVFISACGGGGGDTAPPAVPPPLAAQGLIDLADAPRVFEVDAAGVGGDGGGDGGVGGGAGDGSALRRATVLLIDSQGKTLSGQTDTRGGYLLKFKTADYKPPFVLKVIDAGGNILASANEVVIPAGKAARVNINPLTDKVVSDVLASAAKGTDKAFDGAALNSAGLAGAKTNLLTSIQGALAVAGVPDASQFDPVRSVYRYDGTGVDTIIESISHVREPATGATQLRSKLAPLVTNADGTIVPVLVTASTPLGTSQVAVATNPALTFSKITAWVNKWNECLAKGVFPGGEGCGFGTLSSLVLSTYKQNSLDFFEDFRTLCSESAVVCVAGSELSNPSILFNSDDQAVVEVTIRQPRTGPRSGNLATPIEYTKTLVFKRDDATTGLAAGNWVLNGNQRSFNWSVEPQYFTVDQRNPAFPGSSRTYSGIRLFFDTERFNPASNSFVSADVYAARLTGPGLPAGGVVYAPTTSAAGGFMTLLNRTGAIPPEGTTSSKPQSDFRIAGAVYPTGAVLAASAWPGNAAGANLTHYSETEFTDFAKLQAYTRYTLEIFRKGSTTPIVETSRILAPIEAPTAHVNRPLHDLSPSLAQIRPPQPSATSIVASWVRNPSATRIESAYFVYSGSFASSVNVADAFFLSPASTSVTIPVTQGAAPAMTATNTGVSREIGLSGRAARARFQQSIIWSQ
jgi:hypothetical protein